MIDWDSILKRDGPIISPYARLNNNQFPKRIDDLGDLAGAIAIPAQPPAF